MVINEITLQDGSDAFPLTIGVAAAAGLGALAFSEVDFSSLFSYYFFSSFKRKFSKEFMVRNTRFKFSSVFLQIETILQVLGSAAIIQFASKKLLFAEVGLWHI